ARRPPENQQITCWAAARQMLNREVVGSGYPCRYRAVYACTSLLRGVDNLPPISTRSPPENQQITCRAAARQMLNVTCRPSSDRAYNMLTGRRGDVLSGCQSLVSIADAPERCPPAGNSRLREVTKAVRHQLCSLQPAAHDE
ncbi:hypothetical protein, partial [Variovorax sp. WDL1]|uniref:hypothetical protein n=1 Tax=Variovorax sp. WDL1 TaxID=207745 RepID=UPI001E3E4A73